MKKGKLDFLVRHTIHYFDVLLQNKFLLTWIFDKFFDFKRCPLNILIEILEDKFCGLSLTVVGDMSQLF